MNKKYSVLISVLQSALYINSEAYYLVIIRPSKKNAFLINMKGVFQLVEFSLIQIEIVSIICKRTLTFKAGV